MWIPLVTFGLVLAPAPAPVSNAGEALRLYVSARWLEQSGDLPQALSDYYKALSLDPNSRDLLLRIGEVNAHLGQPERTLEFAHRALALDSTDARAQWLEGAALFNLGRTEASLAPLQRACALDSTNAEYLRTLARVAETLERTGLIESSYARLVQVDDENAEAWFQLAAAQARRGRFADAATSLDRSDALNPIRPGALFLRGWIAEGLGHPDEAIQAYQHHLEVHGDDQTTRRRLVTLLADQGRFADALTEARRVRHAEPADPEAYRVEADLSFRAGKADDGAHLLSDMRQLSPTDGDLVSRSVGILARYGRTRDAVALAEDWRRKHLEQPEAWTLAARALALAGQPDTALARASGAVAMEPDSVGPRRALAHLLDDLHRSPQAEAEWREITRRWPDDASGWLDLGASLDRAGQVESAIEAGRSALRLAPDWAQALNFLGYLLADHDRELDQARRLIERAVQIEPDNGAFLDSMGWVLYRLRRFQDARPPLERAVELTGGDPTVREHLGDLYRDLHLPNLAREQYQRGLAADGSNTRIKAKLRDLR